MLSLSLLTEIREAIVIKNIVFADIVTKTACVSLAIAAFAFAFLLLLTGLLH
jgi:hypothetical protein